MSIEFEGLSEFQEDLLVMAQKTLPKETNKMMKKAGAKMTTYARRESREAVDNLTGNYYKGFKTGKVFKDSEGKTVVRTINSSNHAHLIEFGHNVVRGGTVVGFSTGKLVMNGAAKKYDASGDFEKVISDELDRMLRDHGL